MNASPPAPRVVDISSADTHEVRMAVLRKGTPSRDPRYVQDDLPDTRHLGVRIADRLVATSTWLPAPWPHDTAAPAVQLRGMAVLDDVQGLGVGRLLLDAGVSRARAHGARYVWARARDSAIGFYERAGFAVVGDVFADDATGLDHHLVVLTLGD
jgi:GNAT superfamily N-acetyltransferase